MKPNVGNLDRMLRLTAALGLAGTGAVVYAQGGAPAPIGFAWVCAGLLGLSATFSTCFLYSLVKTPARKF